MSNSSSINTTKVYSPEVIKKTEDLIAAAQQLRRQLAADPDRPRYHFMPPEAWMNDINGAIYWKGRYHIFYQHNPEGGYWKWMQWGHASSVDMVHWVHHPIGLTPDLEGPDREGCFSGGAFISKEGVPMMVYHGVPDGMCLASGQDDLLLKWQKHPANPVIKTPGEDDPNYRVYNVFDPAIWLYKGQYYAVTGNIQFLMKFGKTMKPEDAGDTVYLFKSDDLLHWQYIGPFYRSDRRWTETDEDNAVPDFFPLGNKWMMLFTSHLRGSQYYLGRLEANGERFVPEIHDMTSWAGGLLGGGRTLLDHQGRRIYFDWISDIRPHQRESGWSGVMTLPRIFCLAPDGTLRMEPIPELQVLRMNPRQLKNLKLAASEEKPLDAIQGDSLELHVEILPGNAQEIGVKVRCSPDGTEQTEIVYEPAIHKLKIVMGRSSLDKNIRYSAYRNGNTAALERLPKDKRMVSAQEAPLTLHPGEPLRLRIFLDRSILEVFANNRQCITQMIFPTRPDSMQVILFSRGGAAEVHELQAWDMAPA